MIINNIMDKEIKFSIIMPVYNAGPFLEDSIRSVFAQEEKDWELLAVDDGSTDSSGRILDRFAKEDPRIRVWHQENKGQFFARQKGIENAVGEYLLFLDSDDEFENNCLQALTAVLEKQDYDMVLFTGTSMVDGKKAGVPIGKISDSREEPEMRWLRRQLISSDAYNSLCMKAFKRTLFQGDRTDYSCLAGRMYGEDKARLLYPVTKARRICYIPDSLYVYKRHEDSVISQSGISQAEDRLADGMFAFLRRYMEEWRMEDEESRKLLGLYYMRNYSNVYLGFRKKCHSTGDLRTLRRAFSKAGYNAAIGRPRYFWDLPGREKLKFIISRFHL